MVILLYWSDPDRMQMQMEFHEKSIYKGVGGFKSNQQQTIMRQKGVDPEEVENPPLARPEGAKGVSGH